MSTLITMNPRFSSQLVTVDQLDRLPPPKSLGPIHKPVAHAELVGTIIDVAEESGLSIVRQQFAVSKTEMVIFGVFDFKGRFADRSVSLGFRNSVDCSIALQAVAGCSVFVCDNLMFSGEFTTWERKNTSGIDLLRVVRDGFGKFRAQTEAFDRSVIRLQGTKVSDDGAKTLMWDIFSSGVLPVRLMPTAHNNYFTPDKEWTDCTPRTLWAVHNALTRTVRELSPQRVFEVTAELGRVFNIGTK